MVTHLLVLSEEIDPLVIVVLKYVAFGQFELDNIKQKRAKNKNCPTSLDNNSRLDSIHNFQTTGESSQW